MTKITVIDLENPDGVTSSEHEVLAAAVTKGLAFKASSDFPSPGTGKKFFVGTREMEVAKLEMKVEGGKPMFYFSATFVPLH